MTGLIKRLREADTYNKKYYAVDPLHQEAADRIEELVKENKRLEDQCEGLFQAGMNNGQALIIAEAKLAKAVEALREIITRWDTPSWKDAEATGNVINRARAVLRELEGK